MLREFVLKKQLLARPVRAKRGLLELGQEIRTC